MECFVRMNKQSVIVRFVVDGSVHGRETNEAFVTYMTSHSLQCEVGPTAPSQSPYFV